MGGRDSRMESCISIPLSRQAGKRVTTEPAGGVSTPPLTENAVIDTVPRSGTPLPAEAQPDWLDLLLDSERLSHTVGPLIDVPRRRSPL